MGGIESQAVVRTSAEARREKAAVDLRCGDTESVADEVRICPVDARDGGGADQAQIQHHAEPCVGWAAPGTTWITCQKPLRRALERNETLVQKWLKQEYPRIKALAQREKAEIYFGDAAHIRSDHHAGRTWGKKGETPIVESTGARYGMSLISAVTALGHMRFMIKEKGGVNAEVFIEFLKLHQTNDLTGGVLDRCRIVIAERQRRISMVNCAVSKEKLTREKLNGAHVISFYSSWTLRYV
jgi:hypothetical protein